VVAAVSPVSFAVCTVMTTVRPVVTAMCAVVTAHHAMESFHTTKTLPTTCTLFATLCFVQTHQVILGAMLGLEESANLNLVGEFCTNDLGFGSSSRSHQLIQTSHIDFVVTCGQHQKLCFGQLVTKLRNHFGLHVLDTKLLELGTIFGSKVTEESGPTVLFTVTTTPFAFAAATLAFTATTLTFAATTCTLCITVATFAITTLFAFAAATPVVFVPDLDDLPTLSAFLTTAFFDLPTLAAFLATTLFDSPALAAFFAAFGFDFPTLAAFLAAFGFPTIIVAVGRGR
jgi:hypothetical protein